MLPGYELPTTTCNTTIPASDTTSLISAITSANGAGTPQTLCLTNSTYTLNAVDNSADGANGLPSIVGDITIVGNGATITRDGAAPAFRLFHVAAGGTLNLENMTLTGGSLPDPALDAGAVYNRGTLALDTVTLSGHDAGNDGGAVSSVGTLTITGSTFSNNQAGDNGGAVSTEYGTTTITNTTFDGNSSVDDGGAVDVDFGSTVTINGSLMSNNTSDIDGGAITAIGDLTINDGQYVNNTATRNGGAVSSYAGSATINNASFDGNHAVEDGGAIRIGYDVTVVLDSIIVTNNTADIKGGGLSAEGADSITVNYSTFQTNTASGSGGAIHVYDTDLTVTGSVFTGNSAGDVTQVGGAITMNGPSANPNTTIIQSSTFSNNSAFAGGAIYYDYDSGTLLIQDNTLITSNSVAHRGGGVYIAGGAVTLDLSTVTANTTASSSGAGIYNLGNLSLTNGAVVSNNVSASNGGGIWSSGTVSVTDSFISGNSNSPTTGRGGGLYNITGSSTISGGEFSTNQALDGAAVYVAGGTVTLSSNLHDNDASDDGGGVYVIGGGTLVADFATFENNTAVDDGGAISNKGAMTLTNSQFLTNSAADGGAIHTEAAGSNALNNSCISGNLASVDTDGVRSTVATFDATGNWWGAADGPGGAGPGTGDEVNSNVDYSNFLITGCPAGIGAAGASALVMTALETSTTSLDQMMQANMVLAAGNQNAVTLPYEPGLVDEAVWRVRGTWDLSGVADRANLSWVADAIPRNQTSVLELAVPLDLGQRNNPAQLQFNQKLWLAGPDTFTVEVLPQNGSDWVVVDSQSARAGDWESRTVDLSQFRGQTVRLRFRLETGDELADNETSLGVWLDGVSLSSQR